jgi:hypothetical protein
VAQLPPWEGSGRVQIGLGDRFWGFETLTWRGNIKRTRPRSSRRSDAVVQIIARRAEPHERSDLRELE